MYKAVTFMENKVIYDWVSITSKIHSPDGFIRLLGLDHDGITWEQTKGAQGYQDRLYWEKISIHYNGREDMGIWLEMSGQGCRAFESFGTGDYESLFVEVFENPDEMNITRLDVAFDDHTGLLDIDRICEDTRKQEYVSRFKAWEALDSDRGSSARVGSQSSEILIRIYDKAAERGFDDGRHWVRVELQLRRERARAFLHGTENIGQRFCGVLGNYLRYIDEPDGYDTNRRRWPTKWYWSRLLDGVAPIQIYEKPGAEYNMINLENFVFTQAGGAIFTYLETHTMEQFQKGLQHRGTQLNPKYKQILAQHGKK